MKLNVIESPDIEYAKAIEINQMCDLGRETIRDAYKEKDTYLEWGSGGTTLWQIQEKMNNEYKTKIISVEHDFSWYNKLSKVVKNKYNSITDNEFLYLHKPNMIYQVGNQPLNVVGTAFEENPAYLDEYINPPEINLNEIDVFLVDGLARSICLCLIATKAKIGATVFLHDIDQRENWYKIGVDLLAERSEVSYVYHNMLRFNLVR
jgi:hypothetical protein